MKAVEEARRLMDTADQTLKGVMGTIAETNQNLRSARRITDDVALVTADIKSFSGSVRDIGQEVKALSGNVKQIGEQVRNLGAETVASVCGVRAGVRTGIDVLVRSLFGHGGNTGAAGGR
jgi:uncharacterized protein YoxC